LVAIPGILIALLVALIKKLIKICKDR
jgi:hypothetical protein